ncbi:hypothetical protein COLO4_28057 [Corchorus olitorius]|uniref:Uncharacterized protein n=1 Tax=Corchorus olitorius TaxID=93759 RepID=A0A1R3HMX6_9ROSI|nr:hypothetical protein COLO4_28057 [Corchorus olitorius]
MVRWKKNPSTLPQSNLIQSTPHLQGNEWMRFWKIDKGTGQNFGIAMLARNLQGDSIILCKSIEAATPIKARIKLVRVSHSRLPQLGANSIWCSFDTGKWTRIMAGKTKVS